MYISIGEAQGQLLDLVRRAEAGEEIVLTHEGKSVGTIGAVPAEGKAWRSMSPAERRRVIDEIVARAPKRDSEEIGAGGNHDFLYDEDGLPA